MNILLVDQFGEIGGAQRSALDLIPAILKRGWRVSAALPSDGPFPAALRALGVAIDPIRCGNYGIGDKSMSDVLRFPGDVLSQARRIRALIDERGADLVYVNGPRLLPGAALATRRRTPLLFHCHNYLDTRYAAALACLSLRFSDAAVMASCRFVASPLRTASRVIYNGVDACPSPAKNDGLRIGMVGRIAPQKGQLVFLQAARLLRREFPECEFVICGAPVFSAPGYFDEVRRTAADLPVEFVDWQDSVWPVLSGLTALAVPSLGAEGTTRVILEAFSAGVPVAAFATGGIPEVIDHRRTGILADAATPEGLAHALTTLIRGGERQRIADAARRKWQAQFTVEEYRNSVMEAMAAAADRTTATRRRQVWRSRRAPRDSQAA